MASYSLGVRIRTPSFKIILGCRIFKNLNLEKEGGVNRGRRGLF
jgi:hypothetical protein